MTTPLLSVGLPVYNGERYLREALDSLLAQEFRDFELIISDNASTDGTARICQDYSTRDPRIRYHRTEMNLGAAPNHRRVFELARSPFFKWAAHDDSGSPRLLGRCVEMLRAAPPSVVLVYPRAELIDEHGRVTSQYETSIACASTRPHKRLSAVVRRMELGTPIYGVVRSDVLRQTRLIDGFFGADHVLLAELALLGEIVEIPEPLLKKRLHPERSMAANKSREDFARWYDPSSRPGRLGHGDRIDFETLRSIWRLPLGLMDRLRCSITLLTSSRSQQTRWNRWKGRVGLGLRPPAGEAANCTFHGR